jgi:hypothetical protein
MSSSKNVQEAEEVLKKAEKEKVDNCSAEIEAVLEKYGCTIVPQVIIQGSKIASLFLIVPKREGLSHSRMNAVNGGS